MTGPTGIEPTEVEAALAGLRGGEGVGSVRATTLNLVVAAVGPVDVEETLSELERLGGSRPLRAMVALAGSGRPLADVSSVCWSGAGQEVCTERVVIRGDPAALPSAVASLLVPDLPVFLWWQGGVGEDDRLLRELAVMANRLVIDSDETGLDAVERVVAYAPGIADLAWRRTAPWREAIAALFDGRPQRRQLEHLLGVEVRGPANEARLLAGWLRARLGREVGLDLAARTKRLNQVELHCGDEVFMVRRLKRNSHGVATGPGLADHVVLLPVPDRGRLLAAELDQLGAERTFEDALAVA